MEDRTLIGVSACLLGQKVRYDGAHKRDPFIADLLPARFDLVPVCPEAGCGLGVPREPMRLVGNPARPRLVTRDTGLDVTDTMLSWTRRRLEELAGLGLCGFIAKSRSPSCGTERVPVYAEAGTPGSPGQGIFAKALAQRFPGIPLADEAMLAAPELREAFLARVLAFQRRPDPGS